MSYILITFLLFALVIVLSIIGIKMYLKQSTHSIVAKSLFVSSVISVILLSFVFIVILLAYFYVDSSDSKRRDDALHLLQVARKTHNPVKVDQAIKDIKLVKNSEPSQYFDLHPDQNNKILQQAIALKKHLKMIKTNIV